MVPQSIPLDLAQVNMLFAPLSGHPLEPYLLVMLLSVPMASSTP